MKKIIALLFVAIMVFSLAACGGKSKTGTDNNPGNNSVDNKDGFTVLKVDKDKRISDMEITGMKMSKENYAAHEQINVTVSWKGNPADDTWIGIIPADTPHGSEEENDSYDVDYRYFTDMKSGDTFTFEDVILEPGDYTMRINESDAGGAELAWCAFSVIKDSTEDVSVPEGYAKYVNQGATFLYPTDTYKESIMSGVEKIGDEIPWIRLSISGENYEEAKALYASENGSASDYSLTEITVGEHKALKCIYSDSAAYFMEVYIDTAFIGDKYWSGATFKVEVAKYQLEDMSLEAAQKIFDDPTVWEIINSFYFDSSMKYSY